jgi:hydrogenase maturation protease
VGLLIGERLKKDMAGVFNLEVDEFTGSPMALISRLKGYKQLILIDSIACGLDTGSVALFSEKELKNYASNFHPHGMNLPGVFHLSERMGIKLPEEIPLIGIEAGEIGEFGDELSEELKKRLDEIYQRVLVIIKDQIEKR